MDKPASQGMIVFALDTFRVEFIIMRLIRDKRQQKMDTRLK